MKGFIIAFLFGGLLLYFFARGGLGLLARISAIIFLAVWFFFFFFGLLGGVLEVTQNRKDAWDAVPLLLGMWLIGWPFIAFTLITWPSLSIYSSLLASSGVYLLSAGLFMVAWTVTVLIEDRLVSFKH
ncbi:hypothetical protein BD410DRAFT_357953 [Rickenella mellea]|uniref:Uncharacterized protein n=1 Tax=Rickenella mellea TaxID=50990 RepID=A0A4Y7PZI4_9AGAM|nr:hypothetical protein BD410DRAFT_357953 [Rickenella mellea]